MDDNGTYLASVFICTVAEDIVSHGRTMEHYGTARVTGHTGGESSTIGQCKVVA